MEVQARDAEKTVEIWLTRAEREKPGIKKELQALYTEYGSKKYTVLVFKSGKEALYENTLDMLRWNRKCSAKREEKRLACNAMVAEPGQVA